MLLVDPDVDRGLELQQALEEAGLNVVVVGCLKTSARLVQHSSIFLVIRCDGMAPGPLPSPAEIVAAALPLQRSECRAKAWTLRPTPCGEICISQES